jgi:hypothetical protein
MFYLTSRRQSFMSASAPAAADPPPTATLKRMVLELLASLHEGQRDNEALWHRVDLLLRRLYGPRGERFNPNQLLPFAGRAAGPHFGLVFSSTVEKNMDQTAVSG